jgi:hypothetical protein
METNNPYSTGKHEDTQQAILLLLIYFGVDWLFSIGYMLANVYSRQHIGEASTTIATLYGVLGGASTVIQTILAVAFAVIVRHRLVRIAFIMAAVLHVVSQFVNVWPFF